MWLYHCCSPYPPFPNRHLDERLSDSRLYPWLAHLLDADGYLYWGANILRGADPYATSVGPLPNGSQDPGHPPGDNWTFYPGPDGLRPSMRMVAFREGLEDHSLVSGLFTGQYPDSVLRIAAGKQLLDANQSHLLDRGSLTNILSSADEPVSIKELSARLLVQQCQPLVDHPDQLSGGTGISGKGRHNGVPVCHAHAQPEENVVSANGDHVAGLVGNSWCHRGLYPGGCSRVL